MGSRTQLIAAFLVVLLINMDVAVAVEGAAALNTAPPSPGSVAGEGLLPVLHFQSDTDANTITTSFSCRVGPSYPETRLSPQEANDILQLAKNGFQGEEIGSGTPPNTDRDSLLKDDVLLTDADQNVAVKSKVPSQKIDPAEVAHLLNNHVKGSFGVGLVLDDTLRTGRCEHAKDGNCSVIGDALSYRNEGTAFETAGRNLQSIFPEFISGESGIPGLSTDQSEIIRGQVLGEENEDVEVTGYKRLKQNPILNSILADYFEASLQTNCANGSCTITTYSLFDKLFNNWLSIDMVVAEGAPSLVYRSRRLFNWLGQRGWPWSLGESETINRVKQALYDPNSIYGNIVLNRLRERFVKNGQLELMNQLLTDEGGYAILKSGGFQGWLGKATRPDGFLGQITDFRVRGEVLKSVKDLRAYASAAELTQKAARKKYNDLLDFYTANGVENARFLDDVVQAKIEYAKQVTKNFDIYDDVLNLDAPDWFAKHPQSGFYDLGVYDETTGRVVSFYIDSKPIKHVMRKFGDDGHWANYADNPTRYASAIYRTANNGPNLQLYKVKLVSDQAEPQLVGIRDLEAQISQLQEHFVKLDNGDLIPLDRGTLPFIKEHTTGPVQLFDSAKAQWAPHKELTPDAFAENILNPRVQSAAKNFAGNTDRLYRDLVNMNWGNPRFTSALSRVAQQEEQLIKAYLSFQGGVKWTVAPYAYWYVKRGLNIEDLSFYQLPDTWHDLGFVLSEEAIYDDAYVDFFANGGSDQGDIFIRIINNLPWKFILNQAAENFLPANNVYEFLSNPDFRRDEVENIAFFASVAADECANCSIVLEGENLQRFTPNFFSSERVDAYILEDTQSKEAVEKGQTLIAFGHHTNLEGRTRDIDLESAGDGIDLVEAIKEEETCSDKMKELTLGYDVFDSPESLAAVLGATEAVSYLAFGWTGVFASAALQLAIVPEIQDCVDTHEGYYVHYFVPAKEEQKETEDQTQLATTQVNSFIQDSKERVEQAFSGAADSSTQSALEGIKGQVEQLVNNAEDKGIVQANLVLTGDSLGRLQGADLFYFWAEPGSEFATAYYTTEGKKVLEDRDSNTLVERDFETGQIKVNGQVIVDNPDITRIGVTSTAIPAEEIPQTIGKLSLPNVHELLIEVDAEGNAFVRDSLARNCLMQTIQDQTGLGLGSDNLRDAFGKVDVVVTHTHPAVRPQGNQIIADGTPRKAAVGRDSRIWVYKDRQVELIEATEGDNGVGELRSIQFANGSIVVNPATGELIVWLRHHEQGVVAQEDVGGLQSSVTRSLNPETQCEEPAINLRALSSANTPLANSRVEAFNQSLEHLGPFQVFDTNERRYVLYSDEQCMDHLTVIDKETGEARDFTGTIRQTPEGFEFLADDGSTQKVDFSAENGVPTVTYNEGTPETLFTAQGRNGSFYFDPSKGLWYAENAQLLPLVEAFKELGLKTQANPDGTVTSSAAGNVLNLNLGGGAPNLFNLPSLPEDPVPLALFVLLMLGSFMFIQARERKRMTR